MYVDICVDMYVDMFIDMYIDMVVGGRRECWPVYRHVCGHVHRYMRDMCLEMCHMNACMCMCVLVRVRVRGVHV